VAEPAKTYRVRYRFRVQKKLSVSEQELRLRVSDREIVISAPTPDTKIEEVGWIVMNAQGFNSEQEAAEFGRKLKSASELSSVIAPSR
jgi:hypothetical protein